MQARLTLYQASSWDHQMATRAPRTSCPAKAPGESADPLRSPAESPRGVMLLPRPPPRPRPDPRREVFGRGLVRMLCSVLWGVAGVLVGPLGEHPGVLSCWEVSSGLPGPPGYEQGQAIDVD